MKYVAILILIASIIVVFQTAQHDTPKQVTNPETEKQSEQVVEGGEDRLFAQCLVDSGVVIYVSKTCPACKDLVDKLGGYDVVDGLFVECGQNTALCSANMQTNYVPEIQINGETVDFQNRIGGLSTETGCILP